MENPLTGRRLRVPEDTVGTWSMPEEPGDYCGPVETTDGLYVYFLKPNARDEDAPPAARSIQCVKSPPHVFTEEEDGTLTITASIGDTAGGRPESDGWHGYLTKGVWTKV